YDAILSGAAHLVVWGLVAFALLRGALLASRSRIGMVLAGSLGVNVVLAFLLASWYQALRSDYWGLGLVPLAVIAGAGTITFRRRVPAIRIATAALALALVAAALTWNAGKEVAPSIEASHRRGHEVERIEARVPRSA